MHARVPIKFDEVPQCSLISKKFLEIKRREVNARVIEVHTLFGLVSSLLRYRFLDQSQGESKDKREA